MKLLRHAQASARNHGGSWTDYIEVLGFMDSNKAAGAHIKHRLLLHHREGIELGVKVLGKSI